MLVPDCLVEDSLFGGGGGAPFAPVAMLAPDSLAEDSRIDDAALLLPLPVSMFPPDTRLDNRAGGGGGEVLFSPPPNNPAVLMLAELSLDKLALDSLISLASTLSCVGGGKS
jgi:hypothetical protein